ncbi:Cof-type HAD-IIB family hydrolase [Lacticaseibacillus camelliae]|uniref:HAD superfamily hydrolase n=1 Tax=Lacticaseibacillus camelliae DSM 22697 = JCM 13995 TaxID=1423730 RepID=A0A0R2FAY1_9LACO|nr:Cof-type HAD-IIB family hydrolase [Lacticaseibacillus camelliae]KRN23557.1 HAD superfamily hydrolase [Lacticaseibacillus camelliae DSM 22697 = JCM 13995]
MTIKLIATDIDDTLLNSKRQLTAHTVTVLKQAHDQGIKVVLCTGRPVQAVQPLLDQLGLSGPNEYAITFNGAVTLSLAGEQFSNFDLGRADFAALDQFAHAHQLKYNLRDAKGAVISPNDNISFYAVRQAYDSRVGITRLSPAQAPADYRYVKGMLTAPKAVLDAIEPSAREAFGDAYYVVRSTPFFLEVMNPKANKGEGLQALATKLGLTAEEVMTCGDEANDLPMLKWAGCAIGMANGIDAVKQVATHVTLDNDHDGVAAAVEKYVLGAQR